jgi:hypothetical protein
LINKNIVYIMVLAIVGLSVVGIVSADPSPNGPGQPGAPTNTCGPSNPGTASFMNANSIHAVSQYDIACFQVSQSHP